MDKTTLAAYDQAAPAFADDWSSQPAPDDMYQLLARHFKPGPTADVGCGAGRDVAWLAANGFDARGYDASEGLLREARARHPQLRFDVARLPELAGMVPGAFENVLCETVVMHLDPDTIGAATRRLLEILRPGGALYLSWRVTGGESERDKHGRLYSAFDASRVTRELGAGDAVLHDREEVSASSGKRIHRLVVRKADA
ncbi:class I SAM-dependent methyltransferase [Trinickia terrae]|uniref:Class I SAM-dependent methyltransferase n=1 Tax=Trinickia terrae TaxID=2571161 RepID=A0A4V5PJ20_9BURK|nr:class I SAM-dependent methyltransferase [Trinickia terrae]TKC89710.1 class I SAM-dependent methyltransferase [Trinickia terrae]